MRKFFLPLIAVMILCLTACGSAENVTDGGHGIGAAPKELKIVTTIFPEYDWVRNLTDGTDAEVTLLLDNGADLHSFQPTAEDVLKISNCDIFIYVGGESDKWVDDALAEAVNKDMRVINLLDVMGDKAMEEEIKEGMQAEEEEEEEEEKTEFDEHVWLSLKNAKFICNKIEGELSAADPENAEKYASNLEDYKKKLDELDNKFTELADKAENKTLIFGDRFPFAYFTKDYGFDYYAAFVGCSAETEASFETITFLANKADELGVKTVYTIDGSDGRIARAVIDSGKTKTAVTAQLDSMQSVTQKQVDEGETYLSVMEKNYEVLSGTLN